MSTNFIESCIAERHDYARHAFTSSIGWFSFFVTVNYASMGWLASASKELKNNHSPIILITCLFITQNILAIVACLIMRRYFFRANSRILESQTALLRAGAIPEDQADLAGQTCLPVRLYTTLMAFMVGAIVPVLIAWIVFPFVYPK